MGPYCGFFMKLTNEFDELVNFTLINFGCNTNYEVVIVNLHEWALYHFEREIYEVFLASELEWYKEFIQIEDPESYEKMINRENNILERNRKEYGEVKSLKERIHGPAAMCVELINFHEFNGPMSIKLIEDEISIFLKIHNMKNKGTNFVILLKEDKPPYIPIRNKLELFAHEAYHIVENIEDNYHTNDCVNRIARKIVDEFNNIYKIL